jgi:hypothetical protein
MRCSLLIAGSLAAYAITCAHPVQMSSRPEPARIAQTAATAGPSTAGPRTSSTPVGAPRAATPAAKPATPAPAQVSPVPSAPEGQAIPRPVPAAEKSHQAAAEPTSVAAAGSVGFATQVQPILAARCRPCHFPGGSMYARLPFDRPATILELREKLFTRIKNEKDRQTIRSFLALQTATGTGRPEKLRKGGYGRHRYWFIDRKRACR